MKKTKTKKNSLILSATQSPMNPKRWLLTPACGHEAWITSSRRPTRTTHPCPWADACTDNGGSGPT